MRGRIVRSGERPRTMGDDASTGACRAQSIRPAEENTCRMCRTGQALVGSHFVTLDTGADAPAAGYRRVWLPKNGEQARPQALDPEQTNRSDEQHLGQEKWRKVRKQR